MSGQPPSCFISAQSTRVVLWVIVMLHAWLLLAAGDIAAARASNIAGVSRNRHATCFFIITDPSNSHQPASKQHWQELLRRCRPMRRFERWPLLVLVQCSGSIAMRGEACGAFSCHNTDITRKFVVLAFHRAIACHFL